MSAREEILALVRAALVDAPEPPAFDPDYRRRPDAPDDLVAELAEKIADYRAVVERCGPDQVAGRIAAVVEGLSVVVPDGLPWEVAGAITDHPGLTSADLDQVDAVVTTASVGLARSGTLVLDHGPGQGRRAISLVPDLHVCVVRADQVVADVPQAMPLLDPARPLTWISGPSATSDIELDRVEGVHGPRRLHVIIASEPPDSPGSVV